MGRDIRIFSELGIYHIMFRGVNKQEIFRDEFDYKVMLDYIADVKKKFPFEVIAYCLMTNHVHIIIKEKEMGDISSIMKKILTKYALYFNNKYDRSGHLFEGRYKSKIITTDEYLLTAIRYIHYNPVEAMISESLESYPWSSYYEYVKNPEGLVDKTYVFKITNLNHFKRMHNDKTELFDPFDEKSKKLFELRIDIEKNYNISPESISSLPLEQKKEIIIELKKKYSSGNIEKITGIKRRTINYYK